MLTITELRIVAASENMMVGRQCCYGFIVNILFLFYAVISAARTPLIQHTFTTGMAYGFPLLPTNPLILPSLFRVFYVTHRGPTFTFKK